MRSGDRPGLQNRRVAGNPVTGGFDPHSLPPFPPERGKVVPPFVLPAGRTVELVWEDQPQTQVLASQVLTGNDLKAVNGFDAPERVKPQAFDKPSTSNGLTRFEVPARSYTVMQWGV